MTTLDQQISIMRIEDQTARVEHLKRAYFRATDRVVAAQAVVRQREDAATRALQALTQAGEKLYAMEHPEGD